MGNVIDRDPEVGLFWVNNGRIFHQESVPFSKGKIIDGRYVAGTKNHDSVWEQLKYKGYLDKLLTEKPSLEYIDIPRGRVIFDSENDVYTIFHGNNIGQKEIDVVSAAFNLPDKKIKSEIEIHYNSPDEIDFHPGSRDYSDIDVDKLVENFNNDFEEVDFDID